MVNHFIWLSVIGTVYVSVQEKYTENRYCRTDFFDLEEDNWNE